MELECAKFFFFGGSDAQVWVGPVGKGFDVVIDGYMIVSKTNV